MPKPIIAIGGLGGSGTRVYADILWHCGIFIGDDLNESLDNLLFTRLFKNPAWLAKTNAMGIKRRVDVFKDVMQANKLSPFEILVARNAFKNNPTYPSEASYLKTFMLNQLFYKDQSKPAFWGWKEPNTHILINALLEHIPELIYVHVLRHGLDMAFSNNKQQLQNWGKRFGVELTGTETDSELCRKQLDYWIATTKRIFELKEHYPERIEVVKLESLVENPQSQINDILNLIGIDLDEKKRASLYKIPQTTSTFNRYKEKDVSIFSDTQLKAVESFGYGI
jgi:hypothetical protein